MMTPDIRTTSVSEAGCLAQVEELYMKHLLQNCNLQHRSTTATLELS